MANKNIFDSESSNLTTKQTRVAQTLNPRTINHKISQVNEQAINAQLHRFNETMKTSDKKSQKIGSKLRLFDFNLIGEESSKNKLEAQEKVSPLALQFLRPQANVSAKQSLKENALGKDLNYLWGGEENLMMSGFDFLKGKGSKMNTFNPHAMAKVREKSREQYQIEEIMKGDLNKAIVDREEGWKKSHPGSGLKFRSARGRVPRRFELDSDLERIIRKYKYGN